MPIIQLCYDPIKYGFFGPISNGVLAEILLAKKASKPIRYFKIEKPHKIVRIEIDMVEMEAEVEQFRYLLQPVEAKID